MKRKRAHYRFTIQSRSWLRIAGFGVQYQQIFTLWIMNLTFLHSKSYHWLINLLW